MAAYAGLILSSGAQDIRMPRFLREGNARSLPQETDVSPCIACGDVFLNQVPKQPQQKDSLAYTQVNVFFFH